MNHTLAPLSQLLTSPLLAGPIRSVRLLFGPAGCLGRWLDPEAALAILRREMPDLLALAVRAVPLRAVTGRPATVVWKDRTGRIICVGRLS